MQLLTQAPRLQGERGGDRSCVEQMSTKRNEILLNPGRRF